MGRMIRKNSEEDEESRTMRKIKGKLRFLENLGRPKQEFREA